MKDMCGERGDKPCLRTKGKGGGAVSEVTWKKDEVIEGRPGMGAGWGVMVAHEGLGIIIFFEPF
jgi:hypothetical protein